MTLRARSSMRRSQGLVRGCAGWLPAHEESLSFQRHGHAAQIALGLTAEIGVRDPVTVARLTRPDGTGEADGGCVAR